mgnify:CR=1 FL=1
MTYEEFKEKVGSVILTDDGNCPVTPVVQMLQGKWKLQILYELCIKCPMRFGELKKMLKPITNTALTNALKELEADDLIQRIQYNEMPLRVEYSLTLKGQDLLPVFYAITRNSRFMAKLTCISPSIASSGYSSCIYDTASCTLTGLPAVSAPKLEYDNIEMTGV